MKNIFLFLIIALSLFSCKRINKKKERKNDLTSIQFIGKIKSVTQFRYTAKDSSGEAVKNNLYAILILKFDERGNYHEKITKNDEDSIITFDIYTYDINERLIKDSFNVNKKLCWTTYFYDQEGNLTKEDAFYSDSDKPKKVIMTFFKYDDQGNKIEEDEYNGTKDTLHYKALIKNNGLGQELEKSYFDDKGTLIKKAERVYDEKGNQIDYKLYKHDTLKTETSFKYNDQGNYTEWWKYYGNGELEEKLTYKYNGNGVLLETVGIESDSSSSPNMTFHFENLDKEGNWLKSTHIKNGKPNIILERTIEYYP